MVHITLYIPNSPMPEEYDVKSYGINEGRLTFQVEGNPATTVITTVPYLIRQTVEEKGKSVSPTRSSQRSGHTEWS